MDNPQKGVGDNRLIWCAQMHTYKKLGECKYCIYDKDCQYREKGAMRRVNRKEE